MERLYADHVGKKNHIARSNEGTGVFVSFFFFFATLVTDRCLVSQYRLYATLRMKYLYLLSFDICFIINGLFKGCRKFSI